MRIALTGVSGFIGSAIARQAHAAGHHITGLVRESSRRDHIDPFVDRFVVGNQDDESAWPALLEGADAVIHNSVDWGPIRTKDLPTHGQSNLLASIRLLEASAPRPFTFMSTIAVHHDMRPRWNAVIDEDHPLRPNTEYGAYKAAVEAHLWTEHFSNNRATAAIRPCAVYGIDPNLSRSHGHALIEKIKRGEKIDKAGGGKFVHVEDVAAATLATLSNPKAAAGKPFNLVDCYARWADWALIAAELLGATVEIDTTSPAEPKNTFTKDQAKSLGCPPPFLERGHEGIRRHLEELITLMN
jgi:nucleoside-diphosphate-sugar epimerase